MIKAKFPRKTEIAAWWLIIYGIVSTIAQISFLSILPAWSGSNEWVQFGVFVYILILLVIGILYVLPIRFLFRKERWAWAIAVSMMCINVLILFVNAWMISDTYLDLGRHIVFVLIPLWMLGVAPPVLIILDRKNYFEMVRQREMEKKGK